MSTLNSLVLISLMPVLFFFGSEEPRLKEVRIDMRVGHYHLAAVRLEQLLKEYPESSNCKEMLTLIVNAYAQSQQEKEAVAHLRTLLNKFPESSATLDSKLLKLVPLLTSTQPDVPASVHIKAPSLPILPIKRLPTAATPPSSEPHTALAETKLYTVKKTPVQPVHDQSIRIEASSVATGPSDITSAPPAQTVLPTTVLQKELPPIELLKPTASVISKTTTADTISLSSTLQMPTFMVPPPALTATTSDSGINIKGDHILVLGDTIHRHKMTVLLNRLRTAGLKPLVSKGERSVVMYRLVAACFDTSPTAIMRQKELIGIGTKPFIFREGNSVCAAAGSYVDRENAEKLRKHLTKKRITTHIAENKMVLPTWRITAGIFPDTLTAEEAMRRLALKGFESAVEPI